MDAETTERQTLLIRAYIAAVVGTGRAPFGKRSAIQLDAADKPILVASNSTRNKVLFVTISRSILVGAAPTAIFSQQSGAGSSDFVVSVLPLAVFRFILFPHESISIQGVSAGFAPVVLSVGTESY